MEHNFAADMEIFVYTEILNQILTVTIQVSWSETIEAVKN